MSQPTVTLVGELNPRSVDPRFALFDLPVNSAGWRLRTRILQVHRRTYFSLGRRNLCVGRWDVTEAAVTAATIREAEDVVLVLLGRKVAGAFGLDAVPAFARRERFVCLPHPSGLRHEWNDPAAVGRAHAVLREVAPDVPWGESRC